MSDNDHGNSAQNPDLVIIGASNDGIPNPAAEAEKKPKKKRLSRENLKKAISKEHLKETFSKEGMKEKVLTSH